MLSDKEIEKRMVEALEEGGRHTVDELVKSTGIDEKRIWKALQALETEELCAHITLEGTPRWYGTVPHVKDDPPPKKVRMYHSPPKVPCPKCNGMYGPSGLSKHIASCKGPVIIPPTPIGNKVACSLCGKLCDPRGRGPHERACKAKEIASRPVPDDQATVTVTITPDYTITGPQMPIACEVPIVHVPESKADASPPMARCLRCGSLWRLYSPEPTAELMQCPICTHWITAPKEEEQHAKG